MTLKFLDLQGAPYIHVYDISRLRVIPYVRRVLNQRVLVLNWSWHICPLHAESAWSITSIMVVSWAQYIRRNSGKRSATLSRLIHVFKLGTFRLQDCEFCSLVHSNCLQSCRKLTNSRKALETVFNVQQLQAIWSGVTCKQGNELSGSTQERKISWKSEKYISFLRRCEIYEFILLFNPLTPELNPSAQRCLKRFFTGDFASWTVNVVNICVKNQQLQHLFMQFINYVW
jgi:hypothetical protein